MAKFMYSICCLELAFYYQQLEEYEKALEWFEREHQSLTLGVSHLQVRRHVVRCNQAYVRMLKGEKEKAAAEMDQELAAFEKLTPVHAEYLGFTYLKGAVVYAVIGRTEDADATLEKAEALLRTVPGGKSTGRLSILEAQGQVALAAKRHQQSKEKFKRRLDTSWADPLHPERLGVLRGLALAHLALNEQEEARKVQQQIAAIETRIAAERQNRTPK